MGLLEIDIHPLLSTSSELVSEVSVMIGKRPLSCKILICSS